MEDKKAVKLMLISSLAFPVVILLNILFNYSIAVYFVIGLVVILFILMITQILTKNYSKVFNKITSIFFNTSIISGLLLQSINRKDRYTLSILLEGLYIIPAIIYFTLYLISYKKENNE